MSYPTIRLYIDGALAGGCGEARLQVRNPAEGSLLADYAAASHDDLHAALAAAERGFAVWSRTLLLEGFRLIARATALVRERAPAIARVLTLDHGKSLVEALREVQLAADIIDFLAEEAKRLASRGAKKINAMARSAYRRGAMVRRSGANIVLSPTLTISREEIGHLCDALDGAFAEVERH